MRSLQKKNRRRGYTLVLFVFFMMMSIALAALVIDVGVIRLTKRQMQSMTDAAALEFQRNIGHVGNVSTGQIEVGKYDEVLRAQYKQGDKDNDKPRFEIDPNGLEVVARLRRTGELLPNGETADSPVPFLFGRGLLLGGSSEWRDLVERGVFVRQTTFVRNVPAKTVGPYFEIKDVEGNPIRMIGLINVQFELKNWNNAVKQSVLIAEEDYRKYRIVSDENEASLLTTVSIGDQAKPSDPTATIQPTRPDGFPANYGYVTIFAQIPGTTLDVVVGFGLVENQGGLLRALNSSAVAYRNTSAILPTPTNLTPDQLLSVLTLAGRVESPVTAPALFGDEDSTLVQ